MQKTEIKWGRTEMCSLDLSLDSYQGIGDTCKGKLGWQGRGRRRSHTRAVQMDMQEDWAVAGSLLVKRKRWKITRDDTLDEGKSQSAQAIYKYWQKFKLVCVKTFSYCGNCDAEASTHSCVYLWPSPMLRNYTQCCSFTTTHPPPLLQYSNFKKPFTSWYTSSSITLPEDATISLYPSQILSLSNIKGA